MSLRIALGVVCLGLLGSGVARAEESPPPASAAGEKAEVAAPASGGTEDEQVRLRALEERVNDLKEKIFRSKARLMLLRETVLNGAISGAKARIVHRAEMGSSFVLQSVTYALDGAPIYTKTAKEGEDLDESQEIDLFNGSIVPGNHIISVNLVYRGNGYGVFSYLSGYKFRIKSSYAFTAEEGKATTIRVVPYEKGGFTTDLQDRPAIRYDVEVKTEAPEAAPAAGAPAAEPPKS